MNEQPVVCVCRFSMLSVALVMTQCPLQKNHFKAILSSYSPLASYRDSMKYLALKALTASQFN